MSSGLSAFGMGFAQGREDLRVRRMQDEDRRMRIEDREEARAARAEDREFRGQQRQWQQEDRAVQTAERTRAQQLRQRVAGRLGMDPEEFEAVLAKEKADFEREDMAWRREHGDELRGMELERAKVGLAGARAQAANAGYAAQRARVEDGREDQRWTREQQLLAEADERKKILGKASLHDGTLDAKRVIDAYNESEVFDPGSKVHFVNAIPGRGLYIESDPDEDGNFELQMIPEENVQDFLKGMIDSEHFPRLAAQRRAMEIEMATRGAGEDRKDYRAFLQAGGMGEFKPYGARAGLSAAGEGGGSLAPAPNASQGGDAAPYPEGTQLVGPGGKVFVVKNGVPVPMQ